MSQQQVIVITGTRKGSGKCLAKYFVEKGFQVIGCSRTTVDYEWANYQQFAWTVSP